MALPQVTLYAHPLCPYAQRALYASAFKGFPLTIKYVNMEEKPADFLAVNPLGKVPAAKVLHRGRQVNLSEALIVAEYFDSLPGPALYPRLSNGEVCPLTKVLIDLHVRTGIEPQTNTIFPFFSGNPSAEAIAKGKAAMHVLNDKYLGSGHYLLSTVLGQDTLTMADVMAFPFIERIVALKDSFFQPLVAGEDYRNLFAWFDRLAQTEWAQMHLAKPRHLQNLLTIAQTPAHKGLAYPLSKYD